MRRAAAAVIVALLATSSVAAAVAPGFAPGKTTRASVASDGTPASGFSQSPIISRDGRYVVFVSAAANLAPGAAGLQVYRHDRVTGVTQLVSVALGGGATGAGAFGPSVSGDGRFVAFMSSGGDIVSGDTNNALDVFVRDMTTGTTVAASTTATGAFTASGGSLAGFPGARVLSDDGRYLAFSSLATELVPQPNGNVAQVYVKDLVTGAVVRASVDDTGAAGNLGSGAATISGDGHVVAFTSSSTSFSALTTFASTQIFTRDLVTGRTTLESVPTVPALVSVRAPASPGLSFDGRYLVFETAASFDPADIDGNWDIYLRDRVAGTTTLASPSTNNTFGVDCRAPSISSDGAYVAFHSNDETLVPGDANGLTDVFLYSRVSGQLTLVSLNDAGLQTAGGPSMTPSLSADGSQVAFASFATNLVTSPSSVGEQIYVRDLGGDAAPVVSAGGDARIAEGVTFTRTGSFSDPDASVSWTASVNWGDGTGAQPLALASDKTFTLARLLPPGTYPVTVAVKDNGGLTGTGTFTLVVTNVAPVVDVGGDAELAFDMRLARNGSFTDPGTTERYTATVDYGDGTGVAPLALASDRTFALAHTYAAAGSYRVTVAVSDGSGGTGDGGFNVLVRGLSYAWLAPTPDTVNGGRALPVHFSVTTPDGAPVVDQSVRVTLVDQSGRTVAGPLVWSSSPSAGVLFADGAYGAVLDTSYVPAGTYWLQVSFASASLNGSFSRALSITLAGAPALHPSR